MNIFAPTPFILFACQINTFSIPMFYPVIFIMFLTLIFIVLVALISNMYVNLICIMEIFIHFLYYFKNFFFCFMFGCLLFLAMLLLFCVFINILQVSYLCFTSFNDCNSSSCSTFFIFILILTKTLIAFEVTMTPFEMIYG